jgi:hypothetical protein
MNKLFLFPLILLLALLPIHTKAQVEELEQLALDIQKLAQFKSILSDMEKYYQILSGGYNTVKDLSQGNFTLHQTFLNSLLSVSPAVKGYVRVADIIANQAELVTEYKSTLSQFQGAKIFNPTELDYITTVYSNLFDRSLDDLDELAMILTDNQLRMSDAERIESIDHIYTNSQDKLDFLRDFNNKTGLMAAQRQNILQQNSALQNFYPTPSN